MTALGQMSFSLTSSHFPQHRIVSPICLTSYNIIKIQICNLSTPPKKRNWQISKNKILFQKVKRKDLRVLSLLSNVESDNLIRF